MNRVDIRTVVTLLALVAAAFEYQKKAPAPPGPAPAPVGLSLKGLFVGPTASDDAISVAAMTAELADELEWDGQQKEPKIVTGQAWDDLRVAAREQRMRGVSIGARQPHVRDAIHKYLDEKAGVKGGEMAAEDRVKWVMAYREISRAAEDAAK